MCVGAGSNDCGAHPVYDRLTGSLGHSVDGRSAKAVPDLYRGEIVAQK